MLEQYVPPSNFNIYNEIFIFRRSVPHPNGIRVLRKNLENIFPDRLIDRGGFSEVALEINRTMLIQQQI